VVSKREIVFRKDHKVKKIYPPMT